MAVVVERAGATSLPGRAASPPWSSPGTPALRESVAAHPARPRRPSRSSSRPARSKAGCGPAPWARASLCVAEVGLPDGSGIGLLHDLKTQGWTRTVVISATADPYTVRAALAAGVRAPRRSPAAPPTGPGRPRPAGSEGLSAREIEVLQLVADGQSNKEIGEALGLSALTVKSHLARIARKLGTGDRAEMVVDRAAQRRHQLTSASEPSTSRRPFGALPADAHGAHPRERAERRTVGS